MSRRRRCSRAAGLSCPTMEMRRCGCGCHRGRRTSPASAQCSARRPSHAAGRTPRNFGSAAMKDVAGLDAKRLVAGGHGAFGRVERVTLRAAPHQS